MWKRTSLAFGVVLALIGCDEPASATGGEAHTGVDPATTEEAVAPSARTDCLNPTDPACTTEPRPEAMRELAEAEAAGAPEAGADEGSSEPSGPAAPRTVASEISLARTVERLEGALRGEGFEILSSVRYEGAGSGTVEGGPAVSEPQPLSGSLGEEAPGEIGDAQLIVVRHAEDERRGLERRGASALLDAPRQLVVFERGPEVIVTWRPPPDDVRDAEGQAVAPRLDLLVAEAVVGEADLAERRRAG